MDNFKKWKQTCFNFTPGFKWLVKEIAINPHRPDLVIRRTDEQRCIARALWDTGSTTTIICPEMAKAMDLKSMRADSVQHLLGYGEVNVYLVDLIIQDSIVFQKVEVIEMPVRNRYFDMIIGMDIIQRGDFRVRNMGDKIEMTFAVSTSNVLSVQQQ